jgi:serine protease
LESIGAAFSFTVTGADDRTAPDILSLTLDPVTVDTSTGLQTITVTARIHDDLAGLSRVDAAGRLIPPTLLLNFLSPLNILQTFGALLSPAPGETNDLFSGSFTLPPHTPAGVWTLLNVPISDAIGNVRNLLLGEAQAKGFTTQFTVTGQGDATPPSLRSFDFFPKRIDTSASGCTVTNVAHILDDLSGFYFASGPGFFFGGVSGAFQSPSRRQSAAISGFGVMPSTSDTVATNFIFFPQYAETGIWTLSGLAIRDVAGNVAALDEAAVRRLGFPTKIAVGISPVLSITRQENSILLSWPSWGSDFVLQSRGANDGSDWTEAAVSPAAIGDELVLSVPTSEALRFFRLRE